MKKIADGTRKFNATKTVLLVVLAVLAICELYLWAQHRGRKSSSPALPVDRIVVEKAAHKLSTWRAGQLQKTYRIALGRDPVGTKEQEGDGKTPEGIFTIDARNSASDYHLALHLSYPTAEAREKAGAAGVDPGSDIEIHGLPNGRSDTSFHPDTDWTEGCIALTDAEIEELWAVAPVGTTVEIRP